jgi:hypothetical protein
LGGSSDKSDQLLDHPPQQDLAITEILTSVKHKHLTGIQPLHPLLVLIVQALQILQGNIRLLGTLAVRDPLETNLRAATQVYHSGLGEGGHFFHGAVERLEDLELAVTHKAQFVHYLRKDVLVRQDASL